MSDHHCFARGLRQIVAIVAVFLAARNIVISFKITFDSLDGDYHSDNAYREIDENASRQHAANTQKKHLGSSSIPSSSLSTSSSTSLTPPPPPPRTYVQRIQVSSADFDYTTITPGEDTCFVHIGKTAGSRIGCMLGMPHLPTCLLYSRTWRQHEKFRQRNETPIPHYFASEPHVMHMKRDNCRPRRPAVFMATTRNPILRLRSAFEYGKVRLPSEELGGAPLLFDECYNNFTSLVRDGLSHDIINHENNNNHNNNNTNIPASVWNMTCPQRAWAYTVGARAFGEHSWFNYEFYYDRMRIRSKVNNSHVFVLRQEFLHQDWAQMDRMFGGTNATAANAVLGVKINTLLQNKNSNNNNNQTQNQRLQKEVMASGGSNNGTTTATNTAVKTTATTTTTTTTTTLAKSTSSLIIDTMGGPHSVQKLCQALCLEIQFYKRMLEAAVNLNVNDIEESMEELRLYCPNEPTRVRTCGIHEVPTFPLARSPEDDMFVREGKPRFKMADNNKKNKTKRRKYYYY